MKKTIAIAVLAALLVSCGSKSGRRPTKVITPADRQTVADPALIYSDSLIRVYRIDGRTFIYADHGLQLIPR
jgi:hypothetical protein